MEADGMKIWSLIWVAVACFGMIAILSGHQHHIITFIVAMLMAIIAGREDDDNQLKPR